MSVFDPLRTLAPSTADARTWHVGREQTLVSIWSELWAICVAVIILNKRTVPLRPSDEPLRGKLDIGLAAQDPFLCAADGCQEVATIIHSDAPYCGKHALEVWHSEEEAQSKQRGGS